MEEAETTSRCECGHRRDGQRDTAERILNEQTEIERDCQHGHSAELTALAHRVQDNARKEQQHSLDASSLLEMKDEISRLKLQVRARCCLEET